MCSAKIDIRADNRQATMVFFTRGGIVLGTFEWISVSLPVGGNLRQSALRPGRRTRFDNHESSTVCLISILLRSNVLPKRPSHACLRTLSFVAFVSSIVGLQTCGFPKSW